MSGVITVLVGTTKGLFLLQSDAARQDWTVKGPLCDGWGINHAIGDPRTGTLWAGGGGEWSGAGVWRSTDGGETWQLAKLADGTVDEWIRNDPETAAFFGSEPKPPAEFTGRVEAIWSLGQVGGKLYAGAKPATLFVSEDGGESWGAVESLTDHPSADSWQPGAAGLTLHTIVGSPGDADKIWLGISAAGVFASEDAGGTWERRNRLSNAEACGHHHHPAAPKDGETGHCVHNMVRAGGGGDLLYQQNHHGVWRSSDGGRSWEDITEGLPSTFGFPIAVHPDQPHTLWTLPLNGDSAGRYPPEASAAVWRSRDGGDNWEACREGLPQQHCFFTVLRQAMATDRAKAPGVYFGTNSGSVFASVDEGDSWQEIARHLPTVLCVETVMTA
ncbi:glycoside hydrolase [Mameliella alba]|nr:glycoside hydrolase [Mameliella alba]MBY6170684.1 glycoside hydrolase [Mameliella alba]MBY6175702.1 glycoside hydrolase [Mameliella alba]